ncbi:MerR family transcriptional regulator [Hydrogenophaga sp.]|uniref:MerR family transcriptional regulator n=2 Tax=Hydrogenophaga sp. TaxID=1904254 RepID=UPI0027342F7B|nr:MerR family transcriptional regulator [Hydrogenophaga sp.]MDP3109470.1 MerR family transcriptional regulator [Hydrogenophaga sp.]
MSPRKSTRRAPLPASPTQPSFRSGAVALLADMPVSTLRIWEQRYQAVAPSTASTGHRQYSANDVERVVLLRQLTLHGHAIGSLAGLAIEQLRDLFRTHEMNPPGAPGRDAALRIVVVGQAMARRLERPALSQLWSTAPEWVAVFDSLAEAAQAGALLKQPPIDVLLCHAPGLQADVLPDLKAAQQAWRARHVGVAYRFAGAAARDALVKSGASVVREPADDAALVAWLRSLVPAGGVGAQVHAPARSAKGADPWSLDALGLPAGPAPARRFDDATLTEFAGLSSSVGCECPSHVAELLMQIGGFERYSASCASRSPADAELHLHLQRVAGAARMLFEAALERVAKAEGLVLPAGNDVPSRAADTAA